ncbi:phage integrase central domain-containing protein, partial [Paenirhodobacter populi]
MTFRTAVSKFLASGQLDLLQNRKHAAQWGSTLYAYAYAVPTLGALTVEQIDKHSVADALAPIWWKIPETARRVRGRIETVIVGEEQTPAAGPVAESRIEIELAGGHRMRISGSYDPEALARL